MASVLAKDVITFFYNVNGAKGEIGKIANRSRNKIKHKNYKKLEVAPRIELGNGSFAGSCLTAWLYHHQIYEGIMLKLSICGQSKNGNLD